MSARRPQHESTPPVAPRAHAREGLAIELILTCDQIAVIADQVADRLAAAPIPTIEPLAGYTKGC